MKKTKSGIWYATDPDPRAYAEQMGAQAVSAENAFAPIDTESQAFANFPSATIIPANVNAVNTTAVSFSISLAGATVTKYGTSFFNTAYFGGSALQFEVDGWVYITLGLIFTESVAPGVNQQRAASIELNRRSIYPGTNLAIASRTYTSNLNPQILTGVQTQAFYPCHAGDTLTFRYSASFTSGTVSVASRIGLSYIGPLVLTP